MPIARPRPRALPLAVLAALAGVAAWSPAAQAAIPFTTISSAGPLERIAIGNEGSCQVKHVADPAFALFPSDVSPGDCGTFIATGGALHGPNIAGHDWAGSALRNMGSLTPLVPVSQSAADPLRVTTVYDVGTTGLRVTQTDSYVPGQENFRTDVRIDNTGATARTGVVYRAGDCYLQGGDRSFGFVEAASGGPGCSRNADNAPAGRIEQWVPLTPGSSYMQDGVNALWAAVEAQTPFPNTCACGTDLDTGAGVSWTFSIAPGGTQTFSQAMVFSPGGVPAGQTPSLTTGLTPTPGTGAVVPTTPGSAAVRAASADRVLPMPSNRACTSRRAFAIRVRRFAGVQWRNATVAVNGRPVSVYVYTSRRQRVSRIGGSALNHRRFRALVDLRGLARGTYRVRVRVVTTDGVVKQNSRTYRTCTGRLRGGIPRL